jgi:predicted secreted Zn-dependent protease
MNLLRNFLFAIIILLTASPAYATIYQYFDEEGTLIVTDNPFGTRKPRPRPDDVYQDIKLRYRDDVSYNFYPVSGKNFPELISSTNLNGPLDPSDRKKYAGQTKWNAGWSYTFNSSYTIDDTYMYVSLDILDIEFMSEISVLLPVLQERTTLSSHDLIFWDHFVQKLLEHEHDHVKIVKDNVYRDEAVKKISAITQLTIAYDPEADPDILIKDAVDSETFRIGHDLIMTIKKQNEEYDRITDHGLKAEMRNTFFGR